MLLLVFRFLLAAAGKIEGSFVARHSGLVASDNILVLQMIKWGFSKKKPGSGKLQYY